MTHLDMIKNNELEINGYSPLEDINFLEKDVVDCFKEDIYFKEDSKELVYLVSNLMKRTKKVVVNEVLKALLNLKDKELKSYIYIKEGTDYYSFNDYVKGTDLDPNPYGPSLKIYELELKNHQDENLKRSIKIKIFSEFIKFIMKDKDLKHLLKFFVS